VSGVIFFLVLIILYFSLNIFINDRSSRHSNKFIEKIIHRTFLHKIFKATKQGWIITSFTSSKTIDKLSNLDVKKNKWFTISNEENSGVADPFLFKKQEIYYLFFEYEYHKSLNKGADIAYAISNDGLNWDYKSKILQEKFHQSFPYVFEQDNEVYMLPESYQSNEVRLYKAVGFPNNWTLDAILHDGNEFADTIFLEKESVFYWFTTNLETDELLLFYSNGFKEKWIEHPKSPISKSIHNNRNAGAILLENNKIYRVAQDGSKGYGSGINLYEINNLTKDSFKEVKIKAPLFFKTEGKFKDAIHHLSIIREENFDIIAIDGANFGVKNITIK
tara:strand:+ start:980 stop:1978 length:999 start_codon:yes stop_codon:yes gene_type:complete